jgi:hypothetical protein
LIKYGTSSNDSYQRKLHMLPVLKMVTHLARPLSAHLHLGIL